MKVLDLFCGAGGLSRGFDRAGFDVTGVDISDRAIETYRINNKGKCFTANLLTELIETDAEIIIGGPSCRPWSAVNLTRRGKKHKDFQLVSKFFKHVLHNQPQVFLMENVPLIEHQPILIKSIKKVEKSGYSVMSKVVTYGNYGAPTKRRRLVVFGVKEGQASQFFEKLSKRESPAQHVENVIWHLREKTNGEIQDHVWPDLKTIEKYRDYYRTGKFGWYILNWNAPAPSFGNVMKTYILHPDSFNGKLTRVISVKEALLVMGYDSGFHFPENLGLGVRYQMAVDSVSPTFSYIAADVIKELFDSEG